MIKALLEEKGYQLRYEVLVNQLFGEIRGPLWAPEFLCTDYDLHFDGTYYTDEGPVYIDSMMRMLEVSNLINQGKVYCKALVNEDFVNLGWQPDSPTRAQTTEKEFFFIFNSRYLATRDLRQNPWLIKVVDIKDGNKPLFSYYIKSVMELKVLTSKIDVHNSIKRGWLKI